MSGSHSGRSSIRGVRVKSGQLLDVAAFQGSNRITSPDFVGLFFALTSVFVDVKYIECPGAVDRVGAHILDLANSSGVEGVLGSAEPSDAHKLADLWRCQVIIMHG